MHIYPIKRLAPLASPYIPVFPNGASSPLLGHCYTLLPAADTFVYDNNFLRTFRNVCIT